MLLSLPLIFTFNEKSFRIVKKYFSCFLEKKIGSLFCFDKDLLLRNCRLVWDECSFVGSLNYHCWVSPWKTKNWQSSNSTSKSLQNCKKLQYVSTVPNSIRFKYIFNFKILLIYKWHFITFGEINVSKRNNT